MKEVNPVETFFKRDVVKEDTSHLCQGTLVNAQPLDFSSKNALNAVL